MHHPGFVNSAAILQLIDAVGLGEVAQELRKTEYLPYQNITFTPFGIQGDEDENNPYYRGICVNRGGKRYVFIPGEGFSVITRYAIHDTIPPRNDIRPMTIEEIRKFISNLSIAAQADTQDQVLTHLLNEANLRFELEIGKTNKKSKT